MSWTRRLLNTLRPGRLHRDIERELAFHLAERADRLRADGATEEEARRRARLALGNPGLQAERVRDVDVAVWLDTLLRNVRQAVRALVATPVFTVTAVATLALGIGASAGIFSVLDAVLFEALPFPAGDRLVRVRQVREIGTAIAPARLEDWRRLSSSFSALTGYYTEDVTDTTGELPERVRWALVAPDFLEVWGITPELGPGFAAEEHRRGLEPMVLVSERYWRHRLESDPRVLGRELRIGAGSYTVAGVMPRRFLFPDGDVDLWRPITVDPPLRDDRSLTWYTGIGRLRPAVTPEEARADLARLQALLAAQYPATDADLGVEITPYKETVVSELRGSLWLLFGAATVLLSIACTNIAALLLSRAAHRQREVTMRFALGASRGSIAALLMTEAALLAIAGAAAGLVLAAGAAPAARWAMPDLPRLAEIGVDLRTLAFLVAAAVVAMLLCGVLPALRGARATSSLVRGGRSRVFSVHAGHWLLVGVQVALSVTLLAGAGLLLRSGRELSRVEPGFEPAGVLTFRLSGSWAETVDRARLERRIDTSLEELAALPGVAAAATSWALPGRGGRFETEFALEGRPASEPPLVAEWRTVSPEYFGVLEIPLLAGAPCRRTADQATPQLLVNASFVDRHFGGRSPLGRRLSWESATTTGRVVGVVADARERGLGDEPAPTVYACNSAPNPFPWFLVRTSGEPMAHATAVRARLQELEPQRSVYDVAPLVEQIGDAHAESRVRTAVMTVFAAAALGLACLGVYGTLSYVVGLRRREVGLRLALGAVRGTIVRQLLGDGLRVVGLACACGLALALAAGRVFAGMVYGISPFDPLTLAAVVALVLAVGTLAALVPATRASRVEPMRVLRDE